MSNASHMYPSIFNRLVIQPVSSTVRHFSTFFAHFGFPVYAPGTIAVNVTWMERRFNAVKRIAACSVPIYLQPFTSYTECWSEIATFSYPLAFNAPAGCVPIGIPGAKFGTHKTRIMGLPGSEDSLTIGGAVSTHRVTDRQTDGQTNVQPMSITCAV